MTSLFQGNDCKSAATAALLMTAAATGTALADTGQEANQTGTLTEIVVTAQKRAEKLSETPLSITAISSKTLEELGAIQFRDFAGTIPGLSFTTIGAGQTQVSIRGVTAGNDVSPTVGIYVDEVPYGSSTPFAAAAQLALDVALFDIDRVEVLRGPQGTLYGASTMGGVLKYVTVMPDTNTFGGSARAGVSTTKGGGISYDTAAAVNLPIASDKAALRLSGFYSHDGGYIDNLALGQDAVNQSKIYGGRADFLLLPVESLSVRLTGMTQDIFRNGSADADYGLTTGRSIDGDLDQRRVLAEPFNDSFRLISGTVKYDFGSAALTSISSYQSARSHAVTDYSALYVPELAGAGIDLGSVGLEKQTEVHKITQELRLAGSETYLDWLVGGFFTHESTDQFESLPAFDPSGAPFPLNLLTVQLPSTYKEFAGFATLTYHITSQWDVTGGLRDAHNSQTEQQIGSGILIGSLPQQDTSGSSITYLTDLKYHPTQNFMTYARFATGYRPGGPNLVSNGANGQPLASPTFNPDTLHSYEAGIKAGTPDRKLSVDASIYQINWNDVQIAAVRNNVGILANAPSARNKGGELTVTALPLPQFTVVGAVGITDAELHEDAPDLGGKKGDPLPNTPKFTGTLSGDYVFPLASYNAFAGATLRHVSERVASFNMNTSEPQYHLPEYTTTDVRTGLDIGDARAQLYVRNVFDSRGQLSADTTFTVTGGPAEVSLLQPRTIGISVSTRF
jgi:iron complex outermembrane recepter protein